MVIAVSKQILRALHRAEDGLIAVVLGALVLLAGAQILLRLGFDSGLPWADPWARVMVLWVGLLGAAAAAREGRHLRMDVVTRFLPPHWLRAVWALTHGASAVIALLIGWWCLGLLNLEREGGAQLPGAIPLWWAQIPLPVCFFLIGLRFAVSAWHGPPAEPQQAMA